VTLRVQSIREPVPARAERVTGDELLALRRAAGVLRTLLARFASCYVKVHHTRLPPQQGSTFGQPLV